MLNLNVIVFVIFNPLVKFVCALKTFVPGQVAVNVSEKDFWSILTALRLNGFLFAMKRSSNRMQELFAGSWAWIV